ncbi:hypothetical protein OO012_09040 [Rhodobacteraceae bacterium KMM 6894]|nr:hypothetical protein [Rhodobacteraceae bacterium KMM 6894]
MSDPVTNVEIEDVLSSIRRLVSNESKGLTPQSSMTPEPAAPEAGKLVLAPSFRVDDAAPDGGGDSAQDKAETGESGSDEADTLWAEARFVTDEEQTGDDRDDPHSPPEFRHVSQNESETSDSDDAEWQSIDPASDTADHDGAAEETHNWDDELSDGQWQETEQPAMATSDNATLDQDTLKARVAELEQVVAGRDDQWEPDGTSDDAYSGSTLESLPWEDYSPDGETGTAEPKASSDAASEVESDTDDAPEDTPDEAPAKPRVVAKPAVSIPFDDIPDNFVAEEEETVSSLDRDLPEDDVLTANDDFLDEDALRDLVADIVRQELQGALGERITRNVRKLVRREIHRALASQDLG